jgi:hypothetical protein
MSASDTRRPPATLSVVYSCIAVVAEHLDRRFGWHRLPRWLGILTLLGLRTRLRTQNLYDPGLPPLPPPPGRPLPWRSLDGRGTNPDREGIGAAGTRFGRNVPVAAQDAAARSTPPPADVSAALLARRDGEFLPAKSLNLLAASWLQFEVHDWFAHKLDDTVPDPPLGLAPFEQDPDFQGTLPMFRSTQTHWWDASQLYGADEAFQNEIRAGDASGKVLVGDPLLKAIEDFHGSAGSPSPVPNLWLGLALFHLVFAHEHNAICDRLRSGHADWSGDRLHDTARLINVAVMAKIHTVEWTPALLAHPTTENAIRATWWGLLGEPIRKRFPRIGAGELLSGIPGSRIDDEVAYSLTEEFAAVYRMHPLIPEDVTFRHAADGSRMDELAGGATIEFEQLAMTRDKENRPSEHLKDIAPENAWYSLALSYPGALTLHNYPTFHPKLPTSEGGSIPLDLGVSDILRTRESGIPRYNEFRRSLRLPAASFDDLPSEVRSVYDDIEQVDLIVGLLAERKPKGFAISDTAFRVFLLMASRRLLSDRFFTTDYTPAVYTAEGLQWIERATMSGILRRHYPALEPALRGVENVFKPWRRMPAA